MIKEYGQRRDTPDSSDHQNKNITTRRSFVSYAEYSYFRSLSLSCIAIMISITTLIILIQEIRTSLFLSTFSPWWHEERNTNHKSLCWPYYTDPPTACTVILVESKISTYFCLSRLKRICFYLIRKTLTRASTVEPQLPVFSKSSNSQDYLFRRRHQPPTQFTPTVVQPHFLSRSLLWPMMMIIFSSRDRKSAVSDYSTWNKRHRVVLSLNENWLI